MKKIFFILLLVCGMQLQAQKTLKIINLSATAIQIDDLITSTTTGGFPQYHTKQFGVWSIPAFGTFTLTNTTIPINTTRFPFISNPISVPSFNGTPGWERFSSASVSTISPSNVAWIAGSTQVFYRIQITKGTNSKTIGTSFSGVPTSITSNGWTASYVLTGTAPVQNYTITVQ
jgi:hypothetical protein